ncbi:Contactin [Brachionus plicatilis]|uniref:Contactin n=1 Tax=Brachionus plicatilis TaxID=10195 RepID=A0A3M7T2H9_BRAPC|nr:Contactin [Brachionus plicatilis]
MFFSEGLFQHIVFNFLSTSVSSPLLKNLNFFHFDEIQIPRKPVSNVRCEPYNSTAILVTWDPIEEDDFDILQGKLLGYVVRYWRSGLEENLNYWRKRFLGQRSSAIIIGLQPDTVYFVRVYVFNSAGESVESELFSHRTFRKAPQTMPQYVKVYQPKKPKERKVELPDNRDMYRLVVEWRGISTNNNEEPLEGYYIKVWEYYQHIRNATIFYASADSSKMLRVQGWSVGGEVYNPDTSLLYYNSMATKINNKCVTIEEDKNIELHEHSKLSMEAFSTFFSVNQYHVIVVVAINLSKIKKIYKN